MSRLGSFLRSTTARFVALYLLIQTLTTILIMVFIYQATSRQLLADAAQLVSEERAVLVDRFQRQGPQGTVALIEARMHTVPEANVFLLLDPAGKVLAGNLASWPPVVAAPSPWRQVVLYRVGGAKPEVMGVVAERLGGGHRLLVGHTLDGLVRLRHTLWEALLAALAVETLLALSGAMLLARFMSRRVDEIADVAAGVGDGELARRVPLSGGGDAFDRLARTLNVMLARIEALMDELRMVSDSLAHDLRSPVTRLKARVERALVETQDPTAQATLAAVLGEADSLLNMLNMALQITRTEAGFGRAEFVPVDLGELARDLVELYEPVAAERGLGLSVSAEADAVVQGDRQLLSQALANLVDNAMTYGAGGGSVAVAVSRSGDEIELTVADRGPGIPGDRRADALRRFGRLDPARSTSGSGLGLPLVSATARLHGGQLTLEDNRPGLRVVVRLPIAGAEAA